MEAGKPQINALEESVFGEDLFLVIKLIAYLLIVTFQGRSGEGALWGTFYKGTNPFMREPILEPNNLPKPSPKTIKLKVKISMYEFWEDISFSPLKQGN